MQDVTITTTPDGGVRILNAEQAGPMRPLTDREINAIRERRSDISRQLTSASERREELAGELEDAPAETRQGLIDRIQQLDQRVMQIESDMEASGAMLRTGLVPQSMGTLVPPPEPLLQRVDEDTLAAFGILFSLCFLLPIGIGVMRMMTRRSRKANVVAEPSPEQSARMERLEQAVDAVAIEIERVGEAQRFQARVLAEANMMPAIPVGHSGADSRDFQESRVRYPHP
jgi:hypothetical protein